MAYTQPSRGYTSTTNKAAAPAATTTNAASSAPAGKTFKEPVFSTGLFAPTKEGVKSIGSVQVREDVTIPAGSYINIYPVEQKNEKSPPFRLTVTEGKLKSAAK